MADEFESGGTATVPVALLEAQVELMRKIDKGLSTLTAKAEAEEEQKRKEGEETKKSQEFESFYRNLVERLKKEGLLRGSEAMDEKARPADLPSKEEKDISNPLVGKAEGEKEKKRPYPEEAEKAEDKENKKGEVDKANENEGKKYPYPYPEKKEKANKDEEKRYPYPEKEEKACSPEEEKEPEKTKKSKYEELHDLIGAAARGEKVDDTMLAKSIDHLIDKGVEARMKKLGFVPTKEPVKRKEAMGIETIEKSSAEGDDTPEELTKLSWRQLNRVREKAGGFRDAIPILK
jgi:hypothetical protein